MRSSMEENRNKGISEEDFEKLNKKPWRAHMKDSNHSFETCPICYIDYEFGDEVVTLDCEHAYHPACLKEWLKKNNKCPICKQEVKVA